MQRAYSVRHAPYPAGIKGGTACDGKTPLSHCRLRPVAAALVPRRAEIGCSLRNSMLVWFGDFLRYSNKSDTSS